MILTTLYVMPFRRRCRLGCLTSQQTRRETCLLSKKMAKGYIAIIGALCCCIPTDAQMPLSNSKTVHLNASKSVLEGSTAYYDPTVATWKFNLTMRVPPASVKSSKIRFRFILALSDIGGQCRQTPLFAGICRERAEQSKSIAQSVDPYPEVIPVSFDHVYTGCYKLVVKCCTSLTSCDDCNQLKNWIYTADLGHVKTHLQTIDVSQMNIQIRLSLHDTGVEVEYYVNYSTRLSREQFQPFQQFDVQIRNGRVTRNLSATCNQTFVRFPYCVDNTCDNSTKDCQCLPDGDYTVSVNPIDSRCNPRVCGSNKQLCKRYTVNFNFSMPRRIESFDSRKLFDGSSFVLYIVAPVLALLSGLLFLLAALYLKRVIWPRRQPVFIPGKDLREDERALTYAVKVLLVYDLDEMKSRAEILRNQLVARGVSQVLDEGDPNQEEEVNIMGKTNWFIGHVNDPHVRIVVIRSPETDRCHQILNGRHRTLEDSNNFLLFMTNQLISLSSANGNYERIFVTTYDNAATVDNYLTPFRCFILPQHFNSLLGQLMTSTNHRQT